MSPCELSSRRRIPSSRPQTQRRLLREISVSGRFSKSISPSRSRPRYPYTSFGKLRIVSTEGLIGFKLQAIANNPRRTRDMEDIRALMHENRDSLDQDELREYFRLFGREALLDELLKEIQ